MVLLPPQPPFLDSRTGYSSVVKTSKERIVRHSRIAAFQEFSLDMADVLFAETEQLTALSQYSPSYQRWLDGILASVKFRVHGSDRWSYAVHCLSLVDNRVSCELSFLPHSTVDDRTPGRLVLHDVVCLVSDIMREKTSFTLSSWAIRFQPENAGSFTTLLCKACKEIALLNKLVFPASQVMWN
jgi:hypothetical protein